MENKENCQKLTETFAKALNIDREMVVDDLAYNSILEWDSIAHMALIAKLETTFNVMLDTNDIIDLSSVQVAKEILGKHGVSF
jgi:acyl carrier protein